MPGHRCRTNLSGELMLYLLTASASSSGFIGAFGIASATSQAVAIGITAVPTPLDEEGADESKRTTSTDSLQLFSSHTARGQHSTSGQRKVCMINPNVMWLRSCYGGAE